MVSVFSPLPVMVKDASCRGPATEGSRLDPESRTGKSPRAATPFMGLKYLRVLYQTPVDFGIGFFYYRDLIAR